MKRRKRRRRRRKTKVWKMHELSDPIETSERDTICRDCSCMLVDWRVADNQWKKNIKCMHVHGMHKHIVSGILLRGGYCHRLTVIDIILLIWLFFLTLDPGFDWPWKENCYWCSSLLPQIVKTLCNYCELDSMGMSESATELFETVLESFETQRGK